MPIINIFFIVENNLKHNQLLLERLVYLNTYFANMQVQHLVCIHVHRITKDWINVKEESYSNSKFHPDTQCKPNAYYAQALHCKALLTQPKDVPNPQIIIVKCYLILLSSIHPGSGKFERLAEGSLLSFKYVTFLMKHFTFAIGNREYHADPTSIWAVLGN